MPVKLAGPTIVTSKAKEALAFYAAHFDLAANDYGAGTDSTYWTLTFGKNSELSFMEPEGGEPEFGGAGMFFYIELDDAAGVDAQHARLRAAGVDASPLKTEHFMYQSWATDPSGLRIMIYTTTIPCPEDDGR